MNSKLALAVVAVIAVVGLVVILNKNPGSNNPTPVTNTQPAAQRPIDANVSLTSTGFSPSTVTIHPGNRVVWTNNSGKLATVNSAKHPDHKDYMPLNLGEFDNGKSLQLIFDKPGTYKYHNHKNPTQFGTVVVEYGPCKLICLPLL